jgi:predicted transposase YbfD/YdcC
MYEVKSDDAVSILDYFEDLEDPRSSINRKHLLGDLIVICILAVLGGADGPKAIGVWAASKADWLRRHLPLPHGIPSHDTIGRLLATLKPAAFQSCFEQWIASIRGADKDPDEPDDEIIAIDGKALRRSHDRRRGLGPLFLVSAWSVKRGISLGQLATAEKSNEITAIPELLGQIDVTDAIVTIDAAGCQKEIAAKIIEGGGDYVLALKGNQSSLHEAVEDCFGRHMENDFADVTVRRYEEVVRGHGRVDTLLYYQMSAPASLPNRKSWKGLRTIGMAIRISEQNGKETSEVRYYISSLRLGVRRFAEAVRGHWGIENTLHWCLDVTFREDESRLRNRHAADNVAWLKRFAISLLKQQADKESIAMRRRMAGWNMDYLAQVLGISTT